MDDTAQNPTGVPTVDPSINQTVLPSAPIDPVQMPAPVAPVSPVVNTSPVDPMDNAQVPDLPTVSQPQIDTTQQMPPQPVVQPMQEVSPMQQVTTDPMPEPTPQPVPVDTPQPLLDTSMPQQNYSYTQPSSDMSSLGPVTLEDLMEELQHIEDKLDEMDEKL